MVKLREGAAATSPQFPRSGGSRGLAIYVLRATRKRKSAPAFLAVRVRETPTRLVEGSLEVVLANGRCVRINGDFTVERVSRLLAAAEGGLR